MRGSLLVLVPMVIAGWVAGCSSGGGSGAAACDTAWQVNSAAEAGDLVGPLVPTGTASQTGGVLTLSQPTSVTIPSGDFVALYSKRVLTGDFTVSVNLASWAASTTGGGPALVVAHGLQEGTMAVVRQQTFGPVIALIAYNNLNADVRQTVASSSLTLQVVRSGGNISVTTTSGGLTTATEPSSGLPLTVGLGLQNSIFGPITGSFSATFKGFTVTSGGGCVGSNFQ